MIEGICRYCKNVIKRGFLYQILISFAICHLIDAFRFYRYFHRDVVQFLKSIGLKEKLFGIIQAVSDTQEENYKIYNIGLITLAGLAILNLPYLTIFRLLGGFFAILTGFIYYNPIEKLKTIHLSDFQSLDNLEEYMPKMEFLLLFTLGMTMICHFFKDESEPEKKEIPDETPKETPKPVVKKKQKETSNKKKETNNQKNETPNTPKEGKKKKKKKMD